MILTAEQWDSDLKASAEMANVRYHVQMTTDASYSDALNALMEHVYVKMDTVEPFVT